MKNITGLSRAEVDELVEALFESDPEPTWPPVLGLWTSVVVTLAYWRKNRTEAELGETYGVSQPTVSRAVCSITPLLVGLLAGWAPAADDALVPGRVYVVDGTLLPCWSWADQEGLWSGKHKTTGVNVQVACDLAGRLVWVSDPQPGSRNDTWCLDASGALDGLDPSQVLADRGYVGRGMTTPVKKPLCRDLTTAEETHNEEVSKIRCVVERTIANLKTWRVLHTDYRRPFHTFEQTITAIVGLIFWIGA